MDEIAVAALIFICLVAASLCALVFYDKLPHRQREEDTYNVVRLVANLFVVMTSLVLGLMVNSAKNTFEQIDRDVHAFATEFILLDRTLRQYGAEADTARQGLLAYAQRATKTGSSKDGPVLYADKESEHLLTQVGSDLIAIDPPDGDHTTIWQEARQHYQKLVELRWILVEQAEGAIPGALIAMMASWLVLIFGSFGYRAPRNPVIIVSLVLSAALIAGSVYLILDMNVPYSGPIQVSDAPLQRAVLEMQQ